MIFFSSFFAGNYNRKVGWHKVVDGIALIRWLLKKCTKCKKEKIELLILMLANWKSSFTQYDYVTFKSISKDVLKFFILLKRKSSKVSFFWDPSQDMSSRGFPPKKTGLYLVNQSGACFLQETTWVIFFLQLSM